MYFCAYLCAFQNKLMQPYIDVVILRSPLESHLSALSRICQGHPPAPVQSRAETGRKILCWVTEVVLGCYL